MSVDVYINYTISQNGIVLENSNYPHADGDPLPTAKDILQWFLEDNPQAVNDDYYTLEFDTDDIAYADLLAHEVQSDDNN